MMGDCQAWFCKKGESPSPYSTLTFSLLQNMNGFMQVTAIVKSKLFNNIVNLFILQGFGYIYPILLIPFLINTIGVEKYGLVYYSVAFACTFR